MTEIELLQQIRLNKYEAEAYYTLVAEGPLTGYELGKRSPVPLSRSYEILERLVQKGLALVQPGEPPRYRAERPERFLGQVRSTMTATLDTLTGSLTGLAKQDTSGDFWVIRGRQPILARVQALIAEARTEICLSVPTNTVETFSSLLAEGEARGCVTRVVEEPSEQGILLLLIDAHEALVGVLASGEYSQAVTSTNRALVAALDAYFRREPPLEIAPSVLSPSSALPQSQLDWLAWEDRKRQRLWKMTA